MSDCTRTRLRIRLLRYLLFGLCGVCGLVVSIWLNLLLIQFFAWPPPASYPLALFVQLLINFSLCRSVVFRPDPKEFPFWRQFLQFLLGTLAIRVLDWAVFSFATIRFGIPVVTAQVVNAIVFFVVRYGYNQRLFKSDY